MDFFHQFNIFSTFNTNRCMSVHLSVCPSGCSSTQNWLWSVVITSITSTWNFGRRSVLVEMLLHPHFVFSNICNWWMSVGCCACLSFCLSRFSFRVHFVFGWLSLCCNFCNFYGPLVHDFHSCEQYRIIRLLKLLIRNEHLRFYEKPETEKRCEFIKRAMLSSNKTFRDK